MSHKRNISGKNFYGFTALTALFILFFSFAFIILQFVSKNEFLEIIIDKYLGGGEASEDDMQRANEIASFWSFPVYLSTISGFIIFYVFILFGRTKVRYGYFFRTLWSIIFFAASIGIFFTPFFLWIQIVTFFFLISFGILMLIELFKQESRSERLRAEIREEWKNKRVHEPENFIKFDNRKRKE